MLGRLTGSSLSVAGGRLRGMAKRKGDTKINKSSKCPNCGERRLVPISYGFPSSSTMELSEQGLIMLGGCILTGDDPQLHCFDCDHSVWVDGRTSGQPEGPSAARNWID